MDLFLKTIKSGEENVTFRESLIQWLIFIVKSKDLIPIHRKYLLGKLQTIAKSIDDHTSGGPLHNSSGILEVEIKALVGFAKN